MNIDDTSEPTFVSCEVAQIRELIDYDGEGMDYEELCRDIHRMLDRVCDAADRQFSQYQQRIDKQGEVMAETARRNLRLEKELKQIKEANDANA